MKINVLPIVSGLHQGELVNNETKKLLKEIENISDIKFEIKEKDTLYDTKISLILVQSGGSEGCFLELEKDLKPPYYLLTYGSNNSLAASMEILSYLKAKDKEAEILHGSVSYVTNRLLELSQKKMMPKKRLGVIGKPSDWLIASNVDYLKALEKFQVELIDINLQELIDLYNTIDLGDYKKDLNFNFKISEVDHAKKLSKAIERLKKEYNLSGITLRCFDLLDSIKTTGCLALAIQNDEDSIGTCEGDIPSMISMSILKDVVGSPGFQANPSRIDKETNQIVFAHCTLPLHMATSYEVMTHYESGIGVAFRGKLKEEEVTIFKLSNNLRDYKVLEGKIIKNLKEDNLCRTQVRVQLDETDYFLKNPYGNHHIIVYGHHKNKIDIYMQKQ